MLYLISYTGRYVTSGEEVPQDEGTVIVPLRRNGAPLSTRYQPKEPFLLREPLVARQDLLVLNLRTVSLHVALDYLATIAHIEPQRFLPPEVIKVLVARGKLWPTGLFQALAGWDYDNDGSPPSLTFRGWIREHNLIAWQTP